MSDAADGNIEGQPFWNKRLPWLDAVPLCGTAGAPSYHEVFRDTKTGYCYCKICGFSFGLV